MFVDLVCNDVNCVCYFFIVKVDCFMCIDCFFYVQYLMLEVLGLLRLGCICWDVMCSIFFVGIVFGVFKIKVMELIYDLEKEKRGIYVGVIGWFVYDVVCFLGEGKGFKLDEGQMDICIVICIMFVKKGVVYFQVGGGIVFDSEKIEEWMEIMNKLVVNFRCIEQVEKYYGDGVGMKLVQDIIDDERRKGDEYYFSF